MRFADRDLGIGTQARMLLELLANQEFPDEWANYVSTAAWYNGRERGVSLTFRKGFKHAPLIVVFTECRNSDSMVVYHWEADLFNPPTVADFSDPAYQTGAYFPYMGFEAAADHIYSLVRVWAEKQSK